MKLRLICLTVLLLAMLEIPAQAYTNPGAGLLLWQLVAAAVVGVMYQVRKFWARRRK